MKICLLDEKCGIALNYHIGGAHRTACDVFSIRHVRFLFLFCIYFVGLPVSQLIMALGNVCDR